MWILMCKLKLLYGIIGMDKEILFMLFLIILRIVRFLFLVGLEFIFF